ncbi:VVA0879 family protein [Streptomyces prunicolor]|uniref:VVA0879 family protein n=1 Tax=Streptomyces prunicolor TaxID=67348 RepID=UPI00035F8FCF|nr:VVA0879 family protein [Streptomyces prunicolor]
MSDSRTFTIDELWEEARARFGQDSLNWAFVCPGCKDVATGLDFRKALEERPRELPNGKVAQYSDFLSQECIGRTLGALSKGYSGRGCKWAAYGLLPGPWQVIFPNLDKPRSCFALAPAPAPVSMAGAGGGEDV